uniref:Uncharacterized protein n=1 Tax=Acrobeloides nanus TaxID=290746 RepID=A0A914BZR0_9BILA
MRYLINYHTFFIITLNIPNPPYSNTEAPHTTKSTARSKISKVYNDLDEFVADVKVWIATNDRHSFARRIDRLPNKWKAEM